MKKLLIALLMLPFAALSDPGHSTVDMVELYGVAECDESVCPLSGGGGLDPVSQFAKQFIIDNHCGGDPECRTAATNRVYLVHVLQNLNSPKKDRNYDVGWKLVQSGSQRLLIFHNSDFVGFQGDDIYCTHVP